MIHAVEVPSCLGPLPAKPALLEYYTDPLCSQSWAFEPYWRRLRAEFGHRFEWRNRLGGLSAKSDTACLAVKCAERQSPQAGEFYLRAVREAVMQHGRNPTQPEVLAAVADELAAQVPAVFDAATFHQDLAANAGAPAFCEDLQQVRNHQISRLPTLVMQRGTGPDLMLVGCQPYEVLLHELSRLAPDLFYVASLVDGGAG